MDQITFLYSSSSSSTSSSSSSSNNHPPKTTKPSRPSYTDSLHSVRKPTQKPITKQFIAPLPPTPQKVYKVSCSKFKQAVRMLTSSPEFQSPSIRRLKDIAPPPLILSTIPKPIVLKPQLPPPPSLAAGGATFIAKSPMMDYFESLSPLSSTLSPAPQSYDPFGIAIMSPLGFLSPSSLAWCSSVLLSPTNISGFCQSPIL